MKWNICVCLIYGLAIHEIYIFIISFVERKMISVKTFEKSSIHSLLQEDDDDNDDIEDSGAECVICMSDMRDTLILPCRHLCLCSTCAESLRYQASNCPICRSPFRALLQIRAMRRKQAITVQQVCIVFYSCSVIIRDYDMGFWLSN